MAFSATARIPCRPLSYDNATMAEPKELIIDYEKHAIYLCDVNGDIVDITGSVDIDALISQIANQGDLLKEILIKLDEDTEIAAETAIIESILTVREISETIREISETIKDGSAIDTIPAEKVVESTEKQFVSKDDKNKWEDAANSITNINETLTNIGGLVDIFTVQCTITAGESAWTATNNAEPYTQTITVADMLATDNPIVDVLLSEDYNTAMDQLNSYAFIYKITTFDGSIKVFATEPTEVDISLQMKIDRKNS